MNNRAFTLLEVLIVIVIIGALAALALPSYNTHIERVRASEAVQNLTAVLSAQKRFQLESPTSSYAAGMGSLDITVTGSNDFGPPNATNAATVANITRNSTTTPYTLYIDPSGQITCTCVAATCGTICTQIGYPP